MQSYKPFIKKKNSQSFLHETNGYLNVIKELYVNIFKTFGAFFFRYDKSN